MRRAAREGRKRLLELDNGSTIEAGQVILATGHEQPNSPGYVNPWAADCLADVDPNASLLVLGSGLTMVDFVVAAIEGGHQGKITVISRRGLLPKPHRRADPLKIEAATVPFGAPISQLMRWLRGLVRESSKNGVDWRSVIDGVRPHTQMLWRNLSLASRKSFLAHARPWWDACRHRMAPQVETKLSSAMLFRSVTVRAAKVLSMTSSVQGQHVTIRPRGTSDTTETIVAKVIDCRGVLTDPLATQSLLLRSLLDQGLARPDPLRLGFDVADDCRLMDIKGKCSDRISRSARSHAPPSGRSWPCPISGFSARRWRSGCCSETDQVPQYWHSSCWNLSHEITRQQTTLHPDQRCSHRRPRDRARTTIKRAALRALCRSCLARSHPDDELCHARSCPDGVRHALRHGRQSQHPASDGRGPHR